MILRLRMMAIAVAAVITAVGCTDKTRFTITGQADSFTDGSVKIMLLDPASGLAEFISDTVVNNKFKIQGTIERPVLAFLFLDGNGPLADFMLEAGANYNITIGNTKVTVESDGKEETFNNQLKELQNSPELKKLNSDYWAAHSTRDEAKVNELTQRIESLEKELREKQIELIRNNPTLLAPAYRLFVGLHNPREGFEIADLKRAYEAMGDAAKNTDPGKGVAEYIARVEAVAIGRPAPDFTARTTEGEELSFSNVKAKVKVLDFWASWCTPCRMANPEMVKIYKDYKSKGLEIVGFSLDDDADNWKNAIKEDGLGWIHVSDLKGWGSDVAKMYVVNSIPTVFVIDENNNIIGNSHSPDELRTLIETLIGK